ncbi:hypothetical protein C8N40_103385 [Pontibacter mucosus]|uniref:Uncharacterized protein n=1 Tax=Pontibacter mucosus TaxID=1649266 RepID=A0A2T5YLV2_9BACT|nr:hypothetical protein C8N40_103385 [Pontibacter mucosus]
MAGRHQIMHTRQRRARVQAKARSLYSIGIKSMVLGIYTFSLPITSGLPIFAEKRSIGARDNL